MDDSDESDTVTYPAHIAVLGLGTFEIRVFHNEEALCRWEESRYGLVGELPDDFVAQLVAYVSIDPDVSSDEVSDLPDELVDKIIEETTRHTSPLGFPLTPSWRTGWELGLC